MWGLRSPTPRGRTESCTLRILSDALTSAAMPQWITLAVLAVDFPALRTRAHISVADGPVDYTRAARCGLGD